MPLRTQAKHSFVVRAPASVVFRFFTPAGEELWVKDWRPRYVVPGDGRTEEGMVFVTGEGDQSTIWTLVDFDPERFHSRYVRCTPTSRIGLVEVSCIEISSESSRVEVQYTLTALTPTGEDELHAFEGQAFSAMIEQWSDAIEQRLTYLKEAPIR
jgi:hypothetical protein